MQQVFSVFHLVLWSTLSKALSIEMVFNEHLIKFAIPRHRMAYQHYLNCSELKDCKLSYEEW